MINFSAFCLSPKACSKALRADKPLGADKLAIASATLSGVNPSLTSFAKRRLSAGD